MELLRWMLVLGFATVLAAGCNTVEGAGEDIEAGGEAVSETAEKVEEEID